MDFIKMRKKAVIQKYHDSDIFNTKKNSTLVQKNKKFNYKQPSIEKTKNDIFHTLESNSNSFKIKPKKGQPQKFSNLKLLTESNSSLKENNNNRININKSTCFNDILNFKEFSLDLKRYTREHRIKEKPYNIDQYYYKESAIGRYYREFNGDEINGVFCDKLNRTARNSIEKERIIEKNIKLFGERKKK